MADRILDSIESPNMLALLTDEELAILAGEIRDEILNTTSQTGGHVASSLGAVEIILAVHSLINSPEDKFIFDVGHQSYAHMLLTGRRDEFSTLRQYKGLSGFRNHTPIRMMFTLPGMHPIRFRSPVGLRVRAIFRGRSKRSLRSSAMPLLLAAWRSRP